jgi:hypothetical protein
MVEMEKDTKKYNYKDLEMRARLMFDFVREFEDLNKGEYLCLQIKI